MEGNGIAWTQEQEVEAILYLKHSRAVFGAWLLVQNQQVILLQHGSTEAAPHRECLGGQLDALGFP